jgi:uncharacterized LabA/DUF88 family protein
MEDRAYSLIDGSHLFASISELWRTKQEYKDLKIDISILSYFLLQTWRRYLGSHVRDIYYFKKQDSRLTKMLYIPDTRTPNQKDHWQIKECGQSITSIPDEELQKLDPKYRDQFRRAEKGLDIQLACDAMSLVTSGRATNLVFLVNDRDFVPLFEAIQRVGANTYLTALHSSLHIAKELADLADKYLTLDDNLNAIFIHPSQPPQPTA